MLTENQQCKSNDSKALFLSFCHSFFIVANGTVSRIKKCKSIYHPCQKLKKSMQQRGFSCSQ